MNTHVKGYVLGAIAAASYGMNPLFALPLYQAGMTPDSVLFWRYLFALPILAIMLIARGRSFKLAKNQVLPIAALGILLAVSSLTLFASYNYMAAGIASTLLFVYPIMVAVIMSVVFHEKITKLTMECILLALSGIGLLYEGDGNETLSLLGVALVMLSSLSYAIYIVAVNRPKLQGVATLKLTFYALAFGFLLFVARVDFGQSLQYPSEWYLWVNALCLAIFPTAISFLCTTQAIQYIGSTPTAILGALEPLTAVFFGILVFGEVMTPRLALGITLIICAVSIIIGGSNITTYLVRLRKLFPRVPFKRFRK